MELEKENEGDLSLLEATEYVRQQLASMGVKNVSGRELEVYTRGHYVKIGCAAVV